MKKSKRILKYLLIILAVISATVYGADLLVKSSAKDRIFTSAENIAYNKTGLLLGTAKFLKNGRINLYYKYRIEATVKLYKARKIDFVLVSGDNSTKSYDEPTTIKDDLIANGIPADKIYLDYAGFRTLDSVVRCAEIFGQKSITVISQQFHNERALYIAKHKNIKAIGFNAKDVSGRYGLKVQAREKLARVKVLIDLIFGISPKFLGEKIEVQ